MVAKISGWIKRQIKSLRSIDSYCLRVSGCNCVHHILVTFSRTLITNFSVFRAKELAMTDPISVQDSIDRRKFKTAFDVC